MLLYGQDNVVLPAMCGIAGRAGPGASAQAWSDRGSSDRAVELLAHRGPDGAGRFPADKAGPGPIELLHTRLAINDLTPAGDQPIANEDDSLVMVFNGEIYNSPELRRRCEAAGHTFRSSMDGEVILHLWEMEGIDSLRWLNGIFAVAIADVKRNALVLARDPLGVKPLFYSQDNERLWFASELAALAGLGAPIGGADPTALAQFLSFLWIPDPRTPYAGARTVPPGHALRWEAGRVHVAAYADPLVPPDRPVEIADGAAIAELGTRLREAVDRQFLSDVPIGLMASGGIDSSLLWWAAPDRLARLFTVDWAPDATGERLDTDAAAVSELARRLPVPLDRLAGETAELDSLPRSGDLFADPAHGLTRLIAARARERGLKVLLSGQGGDELFGGYRRHVVASLVRRVRLGAFGEALARALARFSRGGLSAEYAARLARAMGERVPFDGYLQLCTYSTASERARVLGCTEREVSDAVVWERHREAYERLPAGISFLRKTMTVDLQVYLPGLGLAYVDRAGMEHGVEIRVPWLDLDVVRWSLTLPDRLLVRRRRGKWLGRELAAQALSREIADRPKRGFGAPAHRVGGGIGGAVGGAEDARGRGFRQDRYVGLAESVLARHRALDLAATRAAGG